mmetsp:Transcript_20064/g.28096  ORF Transcript_20064/g.28096 Transcript_20064/m.28096 type:complete len:564 (+) Transcript_20064:108-1799(+)
MSFSIKLQLGDDIRRTSLAVPRFDLLCQIIGQLFPTLKTDFAVRYVDEDGDSITVSTDLEMTEALQRRTSSGLVKFVVVPLEGKASAPKPATATSNNAKTQPQSQPNLFSQLPTIDVMPFINSVSPVMQQISQEAQQQVQNIDLCAMWSQLQHLLSNPSTASHIQPILSSVQQLALQAQKEAQSVNWKGLEAQLEQLLSDPVTAANVQVQQFVNAVKQIVPQATVTNNNTASPLTNNNNEPAASAVMHAAICDNCQQSISGIRFKCGNCADYDLCETCEAKRLHDENHIFLKIYKPTHFHTGAPLLPELYNNIPSHPVPQQGSRCPRRRQSQGQLSAKFIVDVNIPDGSETECGSKFVKTWRMRNDGAVAWPEGTVLKFVGGVVMSDSPTIPVKALNVGEEMDISVAMTAPTVAGRYISYFRLCTPDGIRFGHRIWVDFIATAKPEPIAQPVAPQPQIVVPAPQPVAPVVTPAPQPQPVAPQSPKVETPQPQPVAEPAPQPQVVAPAPAPTELSKQALLDICMEDDLKELAAMGFTDREKNKKLWKESKGDMPTIVARLIHNY